MTPKQTPGEKPRTDSLYERRRGYGQAVRIGLAVSVLFHLFLLFVIGRSLRMDAPDARPAAESPAIELQGPLALRIGTVLPPSEMPEEDEAARPPPRETETEEPQPEQPERPLQRPAEGPPVPAADGEAEADDEDGYLTNAEKLQPKEGDERLFPEVEDDELPEYLAQNPYAAYEGEIRARLGVILDSLNLSDEQYRRAREWLTGEDGSEWGVSEEGIHIGGMVIPLDLGALLREEGPRGREARQEMRDRLDIRYQDMIGEADEVRDERARQMRERTKEELEQRLRDSLEAAQDTTEE